MYRIRTRDGSEASYSSLEEFAAAVKRGQVPTDAEIFHTRAGRWLDVKTHPHYRIAANVANGGASEPAGPGTARPAGDRPQPQPRISGASRRPAPAPVPTSTQAPARQASRANGTNGAELVFIETGDAAPRAGASAKPATDRLDSSELEFLLSISDALPTQSAPAASEIDLLFETPPDPGTPIPTPPSGEEPISRPGAAAPARTSGGSQTIRSPSPEQAEILTEEDLEVPPPSLRQPTPAHPPAAANRRAPRESGPFKSLGTGALGAVLLLGAAIAWRHGIFHSRQSAGDRPPIAVMASATQEPLAAPSPVPTSLKPASTGPAPPGSEIRQAAESGRAAPAKLPKADLAPARQANEKFTSSTAPVPGAAVAVSAPGPNPAPAPAPVIPPDVDVSSAQVTISTQSLTAPAAAVVAPSELARRFEAAERRAQQDMLGRLDSYGWNRLFTPSRLATPEGVASARSAWNAGAQVIRGYRGRIARLADAYDDSLLTSERAQRWPPEEMRAWSTRENLSEPAELTQISDLMLTQVDEALGLVATSADDARGKNQTIVFRSPDSATRYATIRSWISQRLETWKSLPESTRPATINRLLQALGEGLPAAQ